MAGAAASDGWGVWHWIITIAGLCGVLFGLLRLLYQLGKDAIADEVSRTRIADWLENRSPWLRYTQLLGWGLDRLQGFFGSPWSVQAFLRCLLLANLYPALFVVMGWGFGGDISLTGGAASPTPVWRKAVVIAGLFFSAGGVGIVVYFNASIVRWVGARNSTHPMSLHDYGWLRLLSVVQAPACIAGLAGALAAVGALVAGGILPAAESVAAAVAVVAMGAVVAGVAGARGTGAAAAAVVAVLVAAAVAVLVSGTSGTSFFLFFPLGKWPPDSPGLVLFILFGLLPFANTILDYPSWAVSRKLMQWLVSVRGKLAALCHVVLDAVAAIVFLFALAAFLPAATQGVNAILDQSSVVWGPFLENAIKHPFTAGFAVTAMLATTLIPTALHLTAAVIALAVSPAPGHAWVVRTLCRSPLAAIDQVGIVCWFEVWGILSLALVIAFCFALWWLVTAALETSAGLTLVDIACWSAQLVGGPGIPVQCLPRT